MLRQRPHGPRQSIGADLCHYFLNVLMLSACTAQNLPSVLVQGRSAPGAQAREASLPQTISWASSSIFVTFEGAETISVDITASPVTNVSYAINWFRFFIDNQTVGDGFTSYKKLQLEVRIPVTSEKHTLRIAKLSDPAKGEATLDSLKLDSGSFLAPEKPPSLASGRRILILGDSYSVGYGDAGAVIPDTCKPALEEISPELRGLCQNQLIPDDECADYIQNVNGNSLAAFGPVAADALSADFQLLATAGGGFVGYSYGIDSHPDWHLARIRSLLPNNADMFNRTLISQQTGSYNLSSWLPEVVLIASGTNDWYSSPPEYSLEEWLATGVEFLRQMSEVFGKPKIIVQVWSNETQNANAGDSSYRPSAVAQYFLALPELVKEANAKGLSNVYLLALNSDGFDNTQDWCGGHPSAVAHKAVARQVVAAIQEYVPEWTVSSPVTLSVDQEAIRPNLTLLDSQ